MIKEENLIGRQIKPERGRYFRLNTLGPGLLFAATSVGASHLVQSTRAGALYGLALLGVIIIANIIKYPAFRSASDYVAATGTTLLEAYRCQGRGVLLLFFIITLSTMTFAVPSLALLSAGLLKVVFSLTASPFLLAMGLIVGTSALLVIGHYRTLENIIKVLIILMVICTLIATAVVIPDVEWGGGIKLLPVNLDMAGIMFIAALIGWMPVPLDVSIWQSLWAKTKRENSDNPPTMAESQFDFNLGYGGTLVLAICFLLMGAGLIHGKDIVLADGATAFSAQLINLYESIFGSFVGPIVGIAALAIVYSSLLTVMDAFPRTLAVLYRRYQGIVEVEDQYKLTENSQFYITVLVIMTLGAALTYRYFLTSLTLMIDIGATMAFVTAPVIATLNYRAITSAVVPLEYQPGIQSRRYSLFCIGTMVAFALAYLYLRVGRVV
ncbi:MAG: Nramp family divalent metal transporter [Emcibacter sp.]|nr:Nramp family divalent metal transporter [Emcibacter sp.]